MGRQRSEIKQKIDSILCDFYEKTQKFPDRAYTNEQVHTQIQKNDLLAPNKLELISVLFNKPLHIPLYLLDEAPERIKKDSKEMLYPLILCSDGLLQKNKQVNYYNLLPDISARNYHIALRI